MVGTRFEKGDSLFSNSNKKTSLIILICTHHKGVDHWDSRYLDFQLMI